MSDSLRERYVAILMDRFNATRYPSAPMMDRLENAIVDRETAESYVEALLEHLEADQYPSPSMLKRAEGLIAKL